MAKQIPVYINDRKLFAEQLTATWQAIAGNVLLGVDTSTNLPKSLFDIGDITEISGGSMVNNVIARNDGQLRVYDSSGLPVGTTTWETLLSAGVTAYTPGFITGFIPTWITGGQGLSFNGGKCRSSDDTTNFVCSALGEKSLMATWDEGFGSSIGAMVGGNHYIDNGVKMTAYNAPSGELCFATSQHSATHAVYKAFYTNYLDYSNVWISPSSPTLPYYLGRKNNQGVIKAIEISQGPSYYFIGVNYKGKMGPKDFEIVGSNSTITDQSSFNSASWTTLASFTDQTWVGCERKIFECASNTTDWAWIGIKITAKQADQDYVGICKLSFLNATVVNELKEVGTSEYKQWHPYHCFVLYNPISGDYDWCCDTSPTGANILSNSAITAAGYTKFRRVYSFSCKTGQIIPEFVAFERQRGALKIIYKNIDCTFNSTAVFTNEICQETLITDLYAPRDLELLLDISASAYAPSSGAMSNFFGSEQKALLAGSGGNTTPQHYTHSTYSLFAQFAFNGMFTRNASIKFTHSLGIKYGYSVGYEDMRIS